MNLTQERKVVLSAVEEAGKFLLKSFRKNSLPEFSMKGAHDILTQADLKAEEIILRHIRRNFPTHQIWSEEAGRVRPFRSGGNSRLHMQESLESPESLWLVDPLDGTTNFSMKNPLFAISIGLRREGKMVLGMIHSPVTGEIFIGEKGKGAYLNRSRLKVSSKKEVKESILLFCHGGEEEDFRKITEIYPTFKLMAHHFRQLGSASLELAYVASGRAESYMTYGGYPWDLSAGILLVEEAGGRASDFERKSWSFESKTLLATNGKVHEEILETLRSC